MNKILSVLLVSFFLHPVMAQSRTDITYSPQAAHIGGITADSIFVVTGSTYSFTVDTPEDKGLVSTTPTLQQLLSEVQAANGVKSTFRVIGQNNVTKENGMVETGDRLLVKTPGGKAAKTYHIALRPMALSGQLQLELPEMTVNTKRDLTLSFTAGQRSPNTTVRIYLPEGIEVNGENTTVNVIGRGDVKLKDLATQSIGRVGTNYPYKKVGNYAVSKNPAGGSVLLFKHLDLRPANGTDLKIVIAGV